MAEPSTESDRICRACTAQLGAEQFNLLDTEKFTQLFIRLSSSQFDAMDFLPKSICTVCYNRIIDFERFQTMCVESYKVLIVKFTQTNFPKVENDEVVKIEKPDPLEKDDPLGKDEPIGKESSFEKSDLFETFESDVDDEDNDVSYDPLNDDDGDDEDGSEADLPNCDVVMKAEISDEEIVEEKPTTSRRSTKQMKKEIDEEAEDQEATNSNAGKKGKKAKTPKGRPKPFACDICPKMFYKQDRFEGHMRQHKGLKAQVKKRRSHRCWVRPYLKNRSTSIYGGIQLLNDLRVDGLSGFRNFARISTSDFDLLVNKIGPFVGKKDTNFRRCVTVDERLAITLRFLATGESYGSLSYLFKVSKPLISRIIPEVSSAIIIALEDYVKMPLSAEEWETTEQGFNNTWNFPHCIGALDGKHIVITAPANTGSMYFNYKSSFSIVLIAIVDYNYCFLYADIGCQGRISDGGVFKNSSFYQMLTNGTLNFPKEKRLLNTNELPYVLVADDAFTLEQNVMKPFPGHLEKGSKERIFNYRLSRARRSSENAFGIMAMVFRVLRKPMLLHPDKVKIVTLCCIYLHNFLRKSSRSSQLYCPMGSYDYENNDTHEIVEGSWRMDNQDINLLSFEGIVRPPSATAKNIREEFARFFLSEDGSVPWQNDFA